MSDIPYTITCNCGKITKEAKREKIFLSIEKAYEENQDRIFEAYATYEEIDKQGDLVKADGIADAIPIWLDRGGTILDSHTNKHIGKGLEYDSQIVKEKRAVWLKSKIFSGRLAHNIDDEAWNKIQKREYKGLSIGAQTFTKFRECNDKQCYNVIPSVQLYEISVVRDPANGGALIIAKEEQQNMEVTKVPETETVEETKKEDVKVGNAKLDIFVHTVANPPAPQDIVKQDDKHEGDCKCGEHEEVLKADDFCQCEDPNIDLGKSHMGDSGTQYVDLFLSLNQKLDGLTKEISDLKLEKAKKEEDEEEEEEESKTKKKARKAFPPKKPKDEEDEEKMEHEDEDKKKADDEDEEDEKKTTEDGLTSEPKGQKKKKGLTKSSTPRPGIIGNEPETSIGSSTEVTKSPMMMEDIIKLTEGNNVNKAFQKIDDMVYKHQAEGGN